MALAAFNTLGSVFVNLASRGMLEKSSSDTKSKIVQWIKEHKTLYLNQLLETIVSHSDVQVQVWFSKKKLIAQVQCFKLALEMIVCDSKRHSEIQNGIYQQLFGACLNHQASHAKFLNSIVEKVQAYADLKFYFYKNLGCVVHLKAHGY